MLQKTLIILGLLCAMSLPALAAIRYSQTIEDLPLMIGMIEKTDEAVVFDKPAGRIVEVAAETHYSEDDVMKFYGESLPQLGWKALSPSRFLREGEILKISVEDQDGTSLVHFNLTPEEH